MSLNLLILLILNSEVFTKLVLCHYIFKSEVFKKLVLCHYIFNWACISGSLFGEVVHTVFIFIAGAADGLVAGFSCSYKNCDIRHTEGLLIEVFWLIVFLNVPRLCWIMKFWIKSDRRLVFLEEIMK